ncbi:hypothetical protein BGZ54_002729 [Gamsiella multidivaricata]|nr:hypothetical protein BGZ54_002729 [Gamsiella multidivaricata]
MSPDPSLKDHLSDSAEDDEDEDEYGIFSAPSQRQMRPQQQQQQQEQPQQHVQQQQLLGLQQQQQYQENQDWRLQQHQEFHNLHTSTQGKAMAPLQALRPHHPMVLQRTVSMPHCPTLNTPYHQSKQIQLDLQQPGFSDTQQEFSMLQHREYRQHQISAPAEHGQHQATISSPQYASSSPSSYIVPGGERFVPLPEQFSDLITLDRYLSMLQLQQPALQTTIPLYEQDMDLMMLSSLNLFGQNEDLLQQFDTSTSSSIQSPPLSWTSLSPTREISPSLSPDALRRQIFFSLPSSSASSPNQVTSSTPFASSVPSSGSSSASASTSAPSVPKRRRRVRPSTIKKPRKINPTSFECTAPECGKVFSRAYNLASHMKTHSSERPFLCEVCPLAFARRHDRERHARLHTGEKPYSCGICGAGFMRNDALHRHQKLCGVAGFSFAIDIYNELGGNDDKSEGG